MKPTLRLLLATSLMVPVAASGASAPENLIPAMDLPANLVPGGVQTPSTSPTMFDVRSALGTFAAQNAPTTALLSTGNVDNITQNVDHDYPPGGSMAGDAVTLEFDVQVPQYANSFSFNFNFLSREYPEWVGSEYNDTFEVWLDSQSYQGQIVFDAFGNSVTVNNALFTVTNASQLAGSGFDADGATGWVTTIAPCTGGETMHISFQIWDESDGVWDSAVLIDNFQFAEDPPPGDGPWTGDDTPENPISVAFVSPKEGDLSGGNDISMYGVNFSTDMTVMVGDLPVTYSLVSSDEIRLENLPPAEQTGIGAAGGPVDLTLLRGPETVVLAGGYTYWDTAGGDIPPRITQVVPSSAHPSGGTELIVRGVGFASDATVAFLDADGEPVAGSGVTVEPTETGTQIKVLTPEMEAGWSELVVTNGNGLSADPSYPFQFTADAAPASNNGGNSGRSACNASGDAGTSPLAFLLVLLGAGLVRRRSH